MNFREWVRRQGAWRRIFVFLLLLAIAWVPLAVPLYWLVYRLAPGAVVEIFGTRFDLTAVIEILLLVLLYGGFLRGLPRWGHWIHRWDYPFAHCGFVFRKQMGRDLLVALLIGVGGVFALFGIETLLGWATPTAPSPRLVRFIFEGLLMALAVAFAEEMMFRGWILAELEATYRSTAALMMNALFFASVHFIKPWSEIVRTFPQFFGLVLLGMALVWARRSPTGRFPSGKYRQDSSIGFPIGLHAGLIWGYYIVNVGGLSEYTGQVPEWVTGIDNNPLAGLLGLVLLGLIGWQFSKTARSKANSAASDQKFMA